MSSYTPDELRLLALSDQSEDVQPKPRKPTPRLPEFPKPALGQTVWTLRQKGMPVPQAELLRHRAKRRLASMSAENREALQPAILKQLARDLAKLGIQPEDNHTEQGDK